MKRFSLTAIALCLLCAVMCAVFAGCSDSIGDTAAPAASSQTGEAQATEAAAPQDAAATEAPAAGQSSTLVGSWEYEYGGFTYTFNADGTGSYDAYGTILNFTYTDNGDSFTLTYDDIDTPSVMEYVIEGDTLTVKDSLGEDVKYIKK